MKTKIFSLIIFLAFAVITTNAQTTFNDGLAKGKSANKKILINVYSDNDTWSQKMDNVYSSGNIMNYVNSNFVYVKLNANGSDKISYNGKDYTSSTLAKHFGATGYPSHIFLLPDGSIIKFNYNGENMGVFSGYLDAGDFEKLLKFFAENKYQNSDLNKFF
jgi:thioredoxin-related protein